MQCCYQLRHSGPHTRTIYTRVTYTSNACNCMYQRVITGDYRQMLTAKAGFLFECTPSIVGGQGPGMPAAHQQEPRSGGQESERCRKETEGVEEISPDCYWSGRPSGWRWWLIHHCRHHCSGRWHHLEWRMIGSTGWQNMWYKVSVRPLAHFTT